MAVPTRQPATEKLRCPGADRGYLVVGLTEKLFAHGDEVCPPHIFGVVLRPAGTGDTEIVWPLCGGDDFAIWTREHPLRTRRPDVHTQE